MTALPRWPDSLLARYEPLEVLQTGDPDYLYLARSQDGEQEALVILFRKKLVAEHCFELLRRNQEVVEGALHPRLLLPRESGEFEKLVYLLFPGPGGKSLQEALERTPLLAPLEALELFRCLLEGLEFLHERDLIHGYLCPSRIFHKSKDNWLLLDSSSEQALGTGQPPFHLRSPAQALGRDPGPRDDLYQLGLLAYLVLTGHRPFEELSPEDPESSRAWEAPLSPTLLEHRPFLPRSLANWVEALVRPDPEDRPASASQALASLLALRQAPDLAPTPTFSGEPSPVAEATPDTEEALTEKPPVLPPAIPSYGGDRASWWQVALLILLTELATANLFRGFGHAPPREPEFPPLPAFETLTYELDASARKVADAYAETPLETAAATPLGPLPTGVPPPAPLPGTNAPPLPGPAPRPLPSPFGSGFRQEVSDLLTESSSWTVTETGSVLRGRDPVVAEDPFASPFLDPDPLVARRILVELPPVQRFRQWVARGGHPEGFPEADRAGLKELDVRFREAGLPRPFHPFAYLSPASRSLSPAEAWRRVLGFESPTGADTGFHAGWFSRAIQEAEAALGELRRAEELARVQGSEDPWIHAVHRLGSREGRMELAAALEPGRLHWRRAIYAASRCLAEQPEVRASVALLLDGFLLRTRALSCLPLLQEEAGELLPGPGDPFHALGLARLTRMRREIRTLAGEDFDPEPDQEEESLLWSRAGARRSLDPLDLHREEVASLEGLRLLRDMEDIPGTRDHWLELEKRLSTFGEVVQARFLGELLETAVELESRLYLDDPDFERILRRARYLAPLLPRAERRLLESNMKAAGEL